MTVERFDTVFHLVESALQCNQFCLLFSTRETRVQCSQACCQSFAAIRQLAHAAVQTIHACRKRKAVRGQAGKPGTQRCTAGSRCRSASVQFANACFQRRHGGCQLGGAIVQCFGAGIQLADSIQIRLQADCQRLCSVTEGEGAARQRFEVCCNGLVAFLDLGCTVAELRAAVSSSSHPICDGLQLLKDGFGVDGRHFIRDGILNFICRRGGQLGGDVASASAGAVNQFHSLGCFIQQGGCIFREVLRDGERHIVAAIRQSGFRCFLRNEIEVQGIGFLQAGDKRVADRQGFLIIIDGLILVHDGDRKFGQFTVGIPHGTEEEYGVKGRD